MKLSRTLKSLLALSFLLVGGLALAVPDKIQGAYASFYIGAVSTGQVLMRSGRTLIGLDVQDQNLSVLTYAATTNVDFSPALASTRTVALTGDLTLTSSNLAAGRRVQVLLTSDGSSRTLTFPVGWTFLGTAPTALAASKTASLELISATTANAGVRALYDVQP